MSNHLEDLRNKIADTEKELEELKAAYRVMERLGYAEKPILEGKEEDIASIDDTGAINLDELDLPVKVIKSSNSLYTNVTNVIERFGDQEFTVNHVYAALSKLGKGSDAKHFKNRVSMMIRKLSDEGVIERTYKGVGNSPHRYKGGKLLKSR